MTAVISFRGVGLTYPGPPPVVALDSVDLVIESGQYVTIVGPSGSGKSTLLNVAGLLDRPSRGVYKLDGINVEELNETQRTALRGRRIGLVFQSFHLVAHRSAVENVALALLYSATPGKTRIAAARQALERVGLANRARALPTTMSGGERQRVAIARAIVHRPSLLLCDEPTGNLDTATAASVLDLLEGLNRDGLTLVIITHDPAVAARSHRVITVRDGMVS